MRNALRSAMTALSLVALGSHAVPGQTRTSLVAGVTYLDFAIGNVGALSAQLRVERGALDLSTITVLPIGGVHVIPDCVPDAQCFERKTPAVLLGAIASLSTNLGSAGWRASAGAGGITAAGMKGPERRSSLAGSLGIDWTSARRTSLTPTLGIRALGLESAIGGMRYVILPSIGLRF